MLSLEMFITAPRMLALTFFNCSTAILARFFYATSCGNTKMVPSTVVDTIDASVIVLTGGTSTITKSFGLLNLLIISTILRFPSKADAFGGIGPLVITFRLSIEVYLIVSSIVELPDKMVDNPF